MADQYPGDRQDVVQDITGQRVYLYPEEGRPSTTPTVQLLDRNGSTITAAATTNVTLDPVNTTLAAAAEAGDTTITVASAADVEVGVWYRLTNVGGAFEDVRVVERNTSTGVVSLSEPLERDYPVTTSTLAGTRFWRTLSASEVSLLRELCRARATYAVGGLNYQLDRTYDVVLVPLPNMLSSRLLTTRRPDVSAQEHAETRGSDYEDLRQAAWVRVREGIRKAAVGWRPALLRTPENVESWALAEFDRLAWQSGIRILRGDWSGAEAMEYLDAAVSREKQSALSALEFMDLDEDDVQSDDEERLVVFHNVR